MPTLLMIGDGQTVRHSVRHALKKEGITILTAATGADGLALTRARAPEVIVLDLRLPDGSGLEWFRALRALDPRRPVIFLTAHGTGETALEAMKQGAFDYLVKPVDLARFRALLQQAFEVGRRPAPPLPAPQPERILGHSPAVQELCKGIGRLAPQEVPVLILGEPGSGKRLVARALHQHSPRANKPFHPLDCALLPETSKDDLFGPGGAAGTLFFDDIADLSPGAQARALHLFRDPAPDQPAAAAGGPVRVLAATSRDLEAEVDARRFRSDLYYRLKVATLRVPALRERAEDIPELAHHFLFRFDRELRKSFQGIAPETLALLRAYCWPGNIRQLQGAIKHAMLHSPGPFLRPDSLPEEVRRPRRKPPAVAEPREDTSSVDLHALIEAHLTCEPGKVHERVIEAVERALLTQALRRTHGHQARASDLLGLNRTTVRAKLRAFGLGVDKVLVGGNEVPVPSRESLHRLPCGPDGGAGTDRTRTSNGVKVTVSGSSSPPAPGALQPMHSANTSPSSP